MDRRADLFSLGSILYEMLTGRHPFTASTPQQILVNVIGATPPRVSSVAAGLPVEVDAVVAKALSKDISQRYESAAVFASDLRRVAARLDVGSGVKTDAYVLAVDDRADRIPLAVLLAGAAIVAGVVGAVWWNLR